MVIPEPENPSKCAAQKPSAKSQKAQLVARIARLVRQAGLGYDDWRYIARRVRQKCELDLPPNPSGCLVS